MANKSPSRMERAGGAYVEAIGRYVARPEDPIDLQVSKGLLAGSTFFMLPFTIIWAGAYQYYGETTAALWALLYMVICVMGLIHLRYTGSMKILSSLQIVSVLLLPFILTVALGGIVGSSAIILTAIMSPLGILMYDPSWHARRWFAAFVLLFALSALLDPLIRRENGLPSWLILTFFVFNISVLMGMIFFMLRTYIQQRNIATELLNKEQEKSERLLLNVLPASIAATLKEDGRTIAQRFEMVTVLFADIVDFTPISEACDPVEMVDMLNDIFTYFDTVIRKYRLEKVRTIGDNYMVVSGAPEPRADHAELLARVALQMRDYQRFVKLPQSAQLQFRFGMNCGPVIGGIIGRTKFHYDVWGDTVNVASRMESHGLPGKIQISSSLHGLLKDRFICERRGIIAVKGKGEMETWFLIGEKGKNN